MKHYVRFSGKLKGAIGTMGGFKTILEEDHEDLQLPLYTTFDHIQCVLELTEEEFNECNAQYVKHKPSKTGRY